MNRREIEEAFRRLDDDIVAKHYENVRPQIASLVLKSGLERHEIEDVIQNTMLAFCLLCRKDSFELRAQAETIMCAIAKRLIKRMLFSTYRLKTDFSLDDDMLDLLIEMEFPSDDESKRLMDELAEAEMLAEIISGVSACFYALSERCKKYIILKYKDKKSHKEIARLMEVTQKTSRKNVSKCGANFKECIEKCDFFLPQKTNHLDILKVFFENFEL